MNNKNLFMTKYNEIIKHNNSNVTRQETELLLFSDRIRINEKGYNYLFKELHFLLQRFIDNANQSLSTKIFVTTNEIFICGCSFSSLLWPNRTLGILVA